MLQKDLLGQLLGPDFFWSLQWALPSDGYVKRWSWSMSRGGAICCFSFSSIILNREFPLLHRVQCLERRRPHYFCVTDHLPSFQLKTTRFILLTHWQFGQSSAAISCLSSNWHQQRRLKGWTLESLKTHSLVWQVICLTAGLVSWNIHQWPRHVTWASSKCGRCQGHITRERQGEVGRSHTAFYDLVLTSLSIIWSVL